MKAFEKRMAVMMAAGVALAGLGSCSDDYDYTTTGDGAVRVEASISSDVKVVSRTDATALREQYGESLQLWLTKPGQGPVRRYNGVDALPTEAVVLPSGAYVAEAWAGDSVGASFTAKYFKAHVPFEVVKGQTVNLPVKLTLANSVVSVDYAPNIEEYLKGDFTMTVGHARADVTFENRDDRKAYFMMPSADPNLTLTLKGTDYAGRPYEQTAQIANAKPATEYVVHVTASGNVEAAGGAMFDLVIDDTEITEEDNVVITLAPEIQGVGFDLALTQSGEEGNVGRKSFYVTAVDELSSVVLEGDDLQAAFGWRNIDLLTGSAAYLAQLEAGGFSLKKIYDSTTGLLTNLRINFDAAWTNSLAEGLHEYTIKAVDCDGRTTQATFRLDVTNAPVVLGEATAATYDAVTLNASIVKAVDGAQGYFYYRNTGSAASLVRSRADEGWTRVAATIEGSLMTAHVTGLRPGYNYEYQAEYAGTLVQAVGTFSTLDGWQIPDSGFENWCTASDNALMPSASADSFWWDSGNHGSITMKKNVTSSDGTYRHSGSLSVKMQSQFVGIASIGKFAAGNVFVGQYLATEGTDGVLGFGRPFTFEYLPKGFSGYARYQCGTIDYASSDAPVAKGDADNGVVYVALLSGDTSAQGDDSYPEWPVVVKTKTQKLFDPQGSNVVAYGAMIFDSDFGGSGMARFSVNLTDVHPNQEVKYIMVVASASRYGDYFTGSTGSCLWLDDLHLDY